jgi:hypothetical protein
MLINVYIFTFTFHSFKTTVIVYLLYIVVWQAKNLLLVFWKMREPSAACGGQLWRPSCCFMSHFSQPYLWQRRPKSTETTIPQRFPAAPVLAVPLVDKRCAFSTCLVARRFSDLSRSNWDQVRSNRTLTKLWRNVWQEEISGTYVQHQVTLHSTRDFYFNLSSSIPISGCKVLFNLLNFYAPYVLSLVEFAELPCILEKCVDCALCRIALKG